MSLCSEVGGKRFVSSLLFRLRRICNHSLLMQSRYTAEQKDVSAVQMLNLAVRLAVYLACQELNYVLLFNFVGLGISTCRLVLGRPLSSRAAVFAFFIDSFASFSLFLRASLFLSVFVCLHVSHSESLVLSLGPFLSFPSSFPFSLSVPLGLVLQCI